MKKAYLSPELDVLRFSFADIMNDPNNVSTNESGSSEHNDDNGDDW